MRGKMNISFFEKFRSAQNRQKESTVKNLTEIANTLEKTGWPGASAKIWTSINTINQSWPDRDLIGSIKNMLIGLGVLMIYGSGAALIAMIPAALSMMLVLWRPLTWEEVSVLYRVLALSSGALIMAVTIYGG